MAVLVSMASHFRKGGRHTTARPWRCASTIDEKDCSPARLVGLGHGNCWKTVQSVVMARIWLAEDLALQP